MIFFDLKIVLIFCVFIVFLAGSIVSQAKTLDQAKAVLKFIDSISEKTLRSTVTLTAARGRGKSAALGLAISAAVAYG